MWNLSSIESIFQQHLLKEKCKKVKVSQNQQTTNYCYKLFNYTNTIKTDKLNE